MFVQAKREGSRSHQEQQEATYFAHFTHRVVKEPLGYTVFLVLPKLLLFSSFRLYVLDTSSVK
jgi:hypothetical protein